MADDAIFIQDNEIAKEIAVYFGLANQLNEIPGEGGRFALYIFETHPTHWVCCGRWVETEEDNGYAAWFLPKSEDKTVEAARARLEKTLKFG